MNVANLFFRKQHKLIPSTISKSAKKVASPKPP